ncbi:Haloacid dehalogenase-like hydrolase domain-containing protein [Zostera marina]|uniref:Haloacid dehalogenase-like hydrolase domain-containing protein n=1 Tax=Zostera marina TaxID=29655 RepID=A0A0K9NTA0_ZOSMR|nr:Haloacid dehalogenase-like hydrolase domain-containing protein [Zostera marina]
MAVTTSILPRLPNLGRLSSSTNSDRRVSSSRLFFQQGSQFPSSRSSSSTTIPISAAASVAPESSSSFCSDRSSPIHALIFDCDGVILESEHLHREAYNEAFIHFDVRCPSSAAAPLVWSPEFYDELQNHIGGGKPKMRWYFGEHGWPSSTILSKPPMEDDEKNKLIDTIQDWKTENYKDTIKSGTVKPRPGVVRLMDSARAAGIKVAVCSAATKSSVILCLQSLIGIERFQDLDCFLAGDDVKEKKPDPSIYLAASKILGVESNDCLVIEDSVIGLQAATQAGMQCIITYTSSTANQNFEDAIAKYQDLSNVRLEDLESLYINSATTN